MPKQKQSLLREQEFSAYWHIRKVLEKEPFKSASKSPDTARAAAEALRVFETYLRGVLGTDKMTSAEKRARDDAWRGDMDSAIRSGLDHTTIGNFVELILAYHDTLTQVMRANVRHTENHAIRDEIYNWLDMNKTSDMSLDDAAEKMAGKVVPMKFRAVRQHCTDWKKLRSAGST